MGYKKFLSNALSIYMDNYKYNNATQIDNILSNITHKFMQQDKIISTLRPLQLKAYSIHEILKYKKQC